MDKRMAQRFCKFAGGRSSATAGGQHQGVAGECFAIRQRERELAVWFAGGAFHALLGEKFNAMRPRFFEQTFDDRFGRVRDGKHPAIRFRFQLHPALSEPINRIRRLKSVKRGNQRPFAARVTLAQRPRLEAGMCHIAPTAAGNPHFPQKLGAFLEKRDVGRWIGLSASDRREKTGGSPTDNYDPLPLFPSPSFRHSDSICRNDFAPAISLLRLGDGVINRRGFARFGGNCGTD